MADPVYRRDYMVLDDMQASIESRLSFQGKACRRFNEISEMIRLAAFICCYCCWMDTWNCKFIPAKVAESVLGMLEKSLYETDEAGINIWNNRMELLLWLVFVGASVTQHEKWYTVGLKVKYAALMRKASDWVAISELANQILHQSVKTSLEEFLYCDDWLDDRMRMREWFALEVLLDAKRACQDETQDGTPTRRLMSLIVRRSCRFIDGFRLLLQGRSVFATIWALPLSSFLARPSLFHEADNGFASSHFNRFRYKVFVCHSLVEHIKCTIGSMELKCFHRPESEQSSDLAFAPL